MERTQFDGKHQYLATPQEYPISANENHSTYDQFIQLRDTLIFSGKYYNGKKGSKLIIGESEETVEVLWKNGFKLSFEPNIAPENTTINYHAGPYVEYTPTEGDFSQGEFLQSHSYDYAKRVQNFGLISCRILEDGNYRIEYKVQVGSNATPIPAGTTKIYAFVIRYKYLNDNLVPRSIGSKDVDPDTQTGERFHIAVWDLQQKTGGASKTFSGQTTGTDPNGDCSVTVTFTLADLYTKITAVGFNEADLNKNDVLAFHVVDQDFNSLDPYIQANSNFFSVKYLDFTLNN